MSARRGAFAFIFVALLLDVLALGVVIPVVPTLVEGFLRGNQSDAVRVGGWLGLIFAVMQFLFTPVQGALSDRFGRRPVLLLSMAGLGLDYVLMALAPNLVWLFIARAISGVTAASFSTANAYVADITPVEKRSAAFGMLGAAFGIGFVLGPALGGLAGSVDARLPFWVAAVLSLVNAVYGFFVLPESLPPERRSKFSLAHANPLGALRFLGSGRDLGRLASAQFLYILAHNIYPAIFVWFTKYRYGWDERTNGLALAVVGVTSIVVQAGLVGRVVEALGERRSMIVGLAFGVAGFLIYGFGPTGTWVWVAIPVSALWGFYAPAAQTLLTDRVSPSEQGRLQGALGSLVGVAAIIAPVLYPRVFAAAIDWKDEVPLLGAPFFVAALLLTGALFLVQRVTHRRHVSG